MRQVSDPNRTEDYLITRRWVRWLVAFAVWTVIALVYAVQVYFILDRANRKMTWDLVLTGPISFWYTWAVFSPVILRLSRRFVIDRQHLLRSLAVHAAASFSFALLHQALYLLMYSLAQAPPDEHINVVARLTGAVFTVVFSMNVVIYWMIVFGSHALQYYKNYRQGQVRTSNLETQLARAQLQALKMQLQPHFLFNTLNSISALLRENVDAADEMLEALGNFLRMTLEDPGAQEVTLRREVEFLEAYLGIERIRFQERLTTRVTIAPEALEARVPAMILQPLVENAIRYGIGAEPSNGFIEVTARRTDDVLELQVTDNGEGVGEGELREGIGMRNSRARLRQLYGDRFHFSLGSDPCGKTTARICIPFSTASLPDREPE